jgi:hypothetical protein
MNSFKHSGVYGDLLYSLPIVQRYGGGRFYLHLDQINDIGLHYYGHPPHDQHLGRMNQQDLEYMQDFMLAQEYIHSFEALPAGITVDHDLDRFREIFVDHPGNYISIYAFVFGIVDAYNLWMRPWLSVPKPNPVARVVINRTQRSLPPELSDAWRHWRDQGIEQDAVFVGLEHEYDLFKDQVGYDIPYTKTHTMLELAEIIAGADVFIGNQSQALALAQGLGVPYHAELRRDLPIELNECYFPGQPHSNYF